MRVSKGNPAFFCLLLVICFPSALCWSGNVCENSKCVYVTKRVCSYRTWLGCCAYKTIRVPQTQITKFCCAGWTHNGNRRCNVPVCSPGCMNGGTCTQPGKCTCLRQFSGPRCGQSQCSHNDPCYPGTCEPGSTRCICAEKFRDEGGRENNCLRLEKEPEIFQTQARMSYWSSMDGGKRMEMYSLLADSSGQVNRDFIWTNRKKFNNLTLQASGQFSMPDLPAMPEYVSDSNLGIVSADFRMILSKDRYSNGKRRRRSSRLEDRDISLNKTLTCGSQLTFTRPANGLLNCHLPHRFDRLLETGDIFTITFVTKSGGFRQLKDLNNGRVVSTQQFNGERIESSVEFRFDLEPPFHCSHRKSCSRDATPLSVQDLTKNPLQIWWGGWQDSLSGLHRYNLEVFPLNFTGQTLQVFKPVEPMYSRAVFNANMSMPITYTPPGLGMFAVVLEIADLANNTRYFRRLTLYDPESRVTVDATHRLFFESASPAANYTYQNDTQRRIEVSWRGFFQNVPHETLRLLAAVADFPRSLEDGRKNVPSQADDNEGDRTVAAIQNQRGIVNFDVAYQKLSLVRGNVNNQNNPPASVPWSQMGLTQTFTVPEKVSDGDTVIAWVRATDVMGNQLVRRTEVTFDETEAEVGDLRFNMNEAVSEIPFSSRFVLEAKDMQSGIARVKWTFKRSNGTVIYTDDVEGKRVQSCGPGQFRTCYCTPRGQCYLIDQSYALSNCHMMVEKERLATEILFVQVDISNAAGLITTRTMKKGQLTMLNGTEAYYPPQHVRTKSVGQSRATLTWDFPPSCYERTDLWVVVPDKNGQEVMRPVHKDAERYDLVDLQPDREYRVQLIARYSGEVKSDPMAFTFRTAVEDKSGLSGGEAAGVAIGVLLLLLVLVVVVVALVFRRRGLPKALQGGRLQNLRNSLSRRRTARSDGHQAFVNTASKVKDAEPEDLYLTASETWSERRPWQVDACDLVLQDQIAEGKFADVYRATWSCRESPGTTKNVTVAAKILKSGFSTSDANKLMKKIEFFANDVGSHDNVLGFRGAVLDNKHLGPVMMLEYCEGGQLDKWLRDQQHSVYEHVMDKLFRMAKDIACAMDYLASKGIVHARLAARNVLLTFLLDVKVAGFSPPDAMGGKVPAKWASPEILQEKEATEESDVWSYGVTLWEIFSLGRTPYPDVSGSQMGPYLKSGKRLGKPECSDDMFYKLMQDCWKAKPSSRPSFAVIKQQLCALFKPRARNSTDDYYYAATQLKK